MFIHPWDMKADGRFGKYWFPWYDGARPTRTLGLGPHPQPPTANSRVTAMRRDAPFPPPSLVSGPFARLVGMPCETTMAACSLIFGGVLERLPNLKVCLAHGGGSFPATIGRIEHGFHTRPDLCATHTKVPPRLVCTAKGHARRAARAAGRSRARPHARARRVSTRSVR